MNHLARTLASVTTLAIATRALAAPTLSDPKPGTNGLLALTLTNAAPGAYVLETATSLAGTNWAGISSFLTPTGAASLETPPASRSGRFFRVRPAATNEAPNPLYVQPSTNLTLGVTTTFTPDGGTLSLTSANQVVYQLTAPAGALGQLETVAMYEVAQVGGVPLGGPLLGAVTFSPDNLPCVAPVTLTIQTPGYLPTNAAGFTWRSPEGEFRLAPTTVLSNTATGSAALFALTDLQPCALAGATNGALAALASYRPSDLTDQFEHALGAAGLPALAHAILRRPGHLAKDDSVFAAFAARRYFDNVLEPVIQQAGDDDSSLAAAIGDYQLWAPSAQSLAGQYPEFLADLDQAQAGMVGALKASMVRGRILCQSDDLQSLSQMLQTYQWMEQSPWSGLIGDLSTYQQWIQDCAQFELKLDSTLSTSDCALGYTLEDEVQATYPIKTTFKPDGSFTTAGTPAPEELTIQSLAICSSVAVVFCQPAVQAPSTGQGVVPFLGFSVPPRRSPRSAPPVAQSIRLQLFPFVSVPNENSAFIGCVPSIPPPELHVEVQWAGVFSIAHSDEVTTGSRGQSFDFKGFSPSPNEVYIATKSYNDSVIIGTAHFQETTTLNLLHTPQ